MLEVSCPNCGKPVKWSPESRWRPFCSERCRLIDLGQWFSEEHAIPGEDADPDGSFVPDPGAKPS
jgi:uncharacterized protein